MAEEDFVVEAAVVEEEEVNIEINANTNQYSMQILQKFLPYRI